MITENLIHFREKYSQSLSSVPIRYIGINYLLRENAFWRTFFKELCSRSPFTRNFFQHTVLNNIPERSNKNIAVKYFTIFYQNTAMTMKYLEYPCNIVFH